jgi:hypothetical protein
MAKLTPQEFQEKHNRRLKAASVDIRSGIEKVTVAPTSLAAAKTDKMKANWNAKMDDGTIKRRLQAVTLEDWKKQALNVGIGRIAAGIDASAGKVVAFAEKLLPAIDAAQAKVKVMPDMTLQDSINRMTTFVTEMSKFRK